MERSKQWRLIVVVLLVLGMGVGGLSWWLLGMKNPPREEQSPLERNAEKQDTLENAVSQQDVRSAIAEMSELNAGPAPLDIDDIIREEEERNMSTVEDLLRKRFPVVPIWRKEVIERVADMSLQGLADNLGDREVIMLCKSHSVIGPCIGWWAAALPRNMIILRLIEEGRKDPDLVCGLLEETIPRKLEEFSEKREEFKEWKRDGFIFVPTSEEIAPQFPIAAAFYVLANIDRMEDPALLERWVAETVLEQGYLQDWFIDYYFRFTEAAGGPHAAAHLAIAGDRVMAGPKQVSSRWNQVWDSDLETIEVLSILGGRLSTDREGYRIHYMIHENFRDHVRQLGDGR